MQIFPQSPFEGVGTHSGVPTQLLFSLVGMHLFFSAFLHLGSTAGSHLGLPTNGLPSTSQSAFSSSQVTHRGALALKRQTWHLKSLHSPQMYSTPTLIAPPRILTASSCSCGERDDLSASVQTLQLPSRQGSCTFCGRRKVDLDGRFGV